MTRLRPFAGPAILAALIGLALAVPDESARAQDFSPLASISQGMLTSIPSTTAQHDVLMSNLGHYPAQKGGRPAPRQPGAPAAATAIPPAVALTSLHYQPTAAVSKAVLDNYLARVRERNPQSADVLARAFAANDYGQVYRRVVSPLGLRDDNVADAFAAYALMGWTAIHGREPAAAEAMAVRNQLAPAIARVAGDRAAIGEELKLQFVTVYGGWQAARQQGTLPAYGETVARTFQQYGLDLRTLELTAAGFRPRGG